MKKTQRVVATAALEQVLRHTSQSQQAFTALRHVTVLASYPFEPGYEASQQSTSQGSSLLPQVSDKIKVDIFK